MAGWCLTRDKVDAFKQALKDGAIDPEKLLQMSSEERRTFFEPIVGKDNAEMVNKTFESKMLTQNIKQSAITWAKQVAGLKPQARQDLISRIERLDERIINPKDEASFLKDLAAQKLGANVSYDEVKQISDLADKVAQAKAKLFDADGNPINRREAGAGKPPTEQEKAYGQAIFDLDSYVTALKVNDADPKGLKALNFLWEVPRKVITYGHGGVIPFTHARNSLYTPGEGKMFTRTVGRAYSYLTKGKGNARWQQDMAAMRSDPTFDFWDKNGLEIKLQSLPSGMGMSRWTKQSFDALKQLRLELANKYWNTLDPKDQTVEAAKDLAKRVNHATGVVNTPPSVTRLAEKTMFAPKLRFAKYATAFADPFKSGISAKRTAKMIGVNLGLLAVNDMVNRYIFGQTGNNTVNWDDPTRADWLRMKVGGMTIPMAPTFELLRLPVNVGATVLDPRQTDKWRPVTKEIATAAHPALTMGYGLLTGKDAATGRTLPFKGVSQHIYPDNRSKKNAIDKVEYGANFTPIPLQPVIKELDKNGYSGIGAGLIEAFISGGLGTHTYENIDYKPKKPIKGK